MRQSVGIGGELQIAAAGEAAVGSWALDVGVELIERDQAFWLTMRGRGVRS